MRTEFFFVVGITAFAAVAVRYIEAVHMQPEHTAAPVQTVPAPSVHRAQASSTYGREVRIKASPDLHYYVAASVNHQDTRFMVDTGASFIALRESDADDAGVRFSRSDFNYPVRTANGETYAALVVLEEVEIEGIIVDDVKAFVLRDEQLTTNLLGMSFLSRLESVEARSGELILKG
ncbi:MAG: TIGR02281 family clan AA aspartic protease [Pseudomonadota bacterium]